LPSVLITLVHAQVNLLLLLLVSGVVSSVVRARHWRAGLCLGGAICLKVFPAFLLGYVLWRKNWRCLGGCGLGLLLGVVVIPAAVLGPARALAYHRQFVEAVLLPGVGAGGNDSRTRELTGIVHTDSQSLMAVAHNTLHLDRATRPESIGRTVRVVAVAAGLLLTGLAVLAAGHRPRGPATGEVLFFGALAVNMLLLCPVCHMGYFCLMLPLTMAIIDRYCLPARQAVEAQGARAERRQAVILCALSGLFMLNLALQASVFVPGLELLRDLGVTMYTALGLWLLASVVLWRTARDERRSARAASLAA
jgi:hypothetical protein